MWKEERKRGEAMMRSYNNSSRRQSAGSNRRYQSEESDSSIDTKKKISTGIIDRIRYDIKECDDLHNMRMNSILKDRNVLESSNREIVSVLKSMKSKLEEEKDKYNRLDTDYKLLQQQFVVLKEDNKTKGETIERSAFEISKYKEIVDRHTKTFEEKKDKWKDRFTSMQEELDRYKKTVVEQSHTVGEQKEMIENSDKLLEEGRMKMVHIENSVEALHHQLDEVNILCKQQYDKIHTLDTKCVQLESTVLYERKMLEEIKGKNEALVAEGREKDVRLQQTVEKMDRKVEEVRREKETALGEAVTRYNGMKDMYAESSNKCAEMGRCMEEMQSRLDSALYSLHEAQLKMECMVKEKEKVEELKSEVKRREEEVGRLKDVVVRHEKEEIVMNNRVDNLKREVEGAIESMETMKNEGAKKGLEIERLQEEKSDMISKINELEGKIEELDGIQQSDICMLEEKTDALLSELRMCREENERLQQKLGRSEAEMVDAESKYVQYRDKYYNKKTECNVMKDRIDRMSKERDTFAQVASVKSAQQGAETSGSKKRVYRDIKHIIDEFKQNNI